MSSERIAKAYEDCNICYELSNEDSLGIKSRDDKRDLFTTRTFQRDAIRKKMTKLLGSMKDLYEIGEEDFSREALRLCNGCNYETPQVADILRRVIIEDSGI